VPLHGTLLTIGKSETPVYYTHCNNIDSSPGTETSTTSTSAAKGIIVFPDVWGLLHRTKSICDVFASRIPNCHVILFDPFRGETKDDHVDNLVQWLSSVPYEPNVKADVNACIDFLVQEKGVVPNRIGAMGFCWGAWAIAKCSSRDNGIANFTAAVWMHPSTGNERKAFGRDEAEMIKNMTEDLPVLVMPAGNDDDRIKNGGDYADILKSRGGQVVEFPDQVHGWTTRGDTSIPQVLRDTEKALQLALNYFQTHMHS
jgi:dienelactone hydrolase